VATRRNKNFEDIFIRFGATHERDGQTDGRTDRHRVTAYTALMHMRRAVKIAFCILASRSKMADLRHLGFK